MPARFNPPPGWPTPPHGWQPPPNWQPDPNWPPAPTGWQFWLDDHPKLPNQPPPDRPGSHGSVARWLGWAGLVVTVLLCLFNGGFSSGLAMAGLYVLVVGIIALARGQVGWARLGSRAAGGVTTAAGLAVLLVGGATAPDTTPSAQPSVPMVAKAAVTTARSPIVSIPTDPGAGASVDSTPSPAVTKAKTPVATRTRAVVATRHVAQPKPSASKKSKAKTKPQPKPVTPSCYPLTNGGNCYEPGEFCRNSDHGASGVAGDGKKIVCRDNNGWRWEPA